jgi:ClpP class serine protease
MRYEQILAAVAATPWAIEPVKGQMLAEILSRRAEGRDADPAAIAAAVEAKKPKANRGRSTVALVPLYGVMTQRADWFTEMSGMVSTETVGRAIDEAAADPNVEAIVLDVDSPGGSVFGTEELNRKIAAAAKSKKVIAVANSMAASAAYYAAAAASELYTMHVDRSEEMKQKGRTVTLVAAGERKVAGNEFGPLDQLGRAEMEETVRGYYEQFVKAVARGRNVTQTAVREGFGKGGMVLAEAAVKEGMADKVASLDEVLGRYGVSVGDVAPSAEERRRGIELRKRRLALG